MTRRPPVDPDALLQALDREVARCRQYSNSDDFHAAAKIEEEPRLFEPIDLPRWRSHNRSKLREPLKLEDFLKLYDWAFIRAAYECILGRAPDEEGATHYLEGLRNGTFSKVRVLSALRFSEEGKRQKVRVRGLKFALVVHLLSRVRFVGGLISWLATVGRISAIARRFEEFAEKTARQQQDLGEVLNGQARVAEFALRDLRNALTDHPQEQRLKEEVERHARQLQELESNVAQSALKKEVAELRRDFERVEKEMPFEGRLEQFEHQIRSKVGELESIVGRHDGKLSSKAAVGLGAQEAMDANAYFELEQRFRGSSDTISRRVESHLPAVKTAVDQCGGGRLVDLGPGRGEWLGLLRAKGFDAYGVDNNPSMIRECRENGLEVVEGDAVEHLSQLPNESLAGITGIHIIEHLPYSAQIDLLQESLRVLKPGGMLLLETPNPENVIVGSCNFYLDPTHQKPIPPVLLEHMFHGSGYLDVAIHRLADDRPQPSAPLFDKEAPDSEATGWLVDLVKGHFHCPPDYAVVGYKPKPGA